MLDFWLKPHENPRYHRALLDQPYYEILDPSIVKPLAVALFAIGQLLVLSSTYALGITGNRMSYRFPLPAHFGRYLGTYLGDYFGILMEHRVEGFPFNILTDPMYDGSTMCFAATALWYVELSRDAPRRSNCSHFGS